MKNRLFILIAAAAVAATAVSIYGIKMMLDELDSIEMEVD